jgi:hypothetical protein
MMSRTIIVMKTPSVKILSISASIKAPRVEQSFHRRAMKPSSQSVHEANPYVKTANVAPHRVGKYRRVTIVSNSGKREIVMRLGSDRIVVAMQGLTKSAAIVLRRF